MHSPNTVEIRTALQTLATLQQKMLAISTTNNTWPTQNDLVQGYDFWACTQFTRTRKGPYDVTWKSAVRINAATGGIERRLGPHFFCTLKPIPGTLKTLISLRHVGVQSRMFRVILQVDDVNARGVVIYKATPALGHDPEKPDDARNPAEVVTPNPLLLFYPLDPSNPTDDKTPPYDKVEYVMMFDGDAPLHMRCFYNDWIPGLPPGKPALWQQLEDGGPPPVVPGNEN